MRATDVPDTACSLSVPRPGPVGDATDQELIALAVAQAVTGLVDGTLLGCANYAGCRSKSEFAGYAAYG
jgi:hypothetical protein